MSTMYLAVMYMFQKKYAEAEPYLAKAVNLFRRYYGEEHIATLGLKMLLAQTYVGQQKYADAETLLLANYEAATKAREKIPASERMGFPEIGQSIVELYEKWGKKDKVDEWQKKLDAERAARKP
jgi:hypothetical protein